MTYVKSYAAHMEVKKGYEYVFSCPSSLSLSFAVWLVDDYTQKEPIGEVRVTLKGENITTVKAVKNLSGYHTFSGLSEGRYTLNVESELYFPRKSQLILPLLAIRKNLKSFASDRDPCILFQTEQLL